MASRGSDARGGDELRYEIKLVGEAWLRAELASRLFQHPVGLRRAYPARRVNSLYLDTHGGRALEENLDGLSHREKLRLRWYGAEAGPLRVQLERKVRENQLGWKDRFVFPEPVRIDGERRAALMTSISGSVPPPWREAVAGLEPVQWIWYRREYLATRDGRLRVTLDTSLRAADQRDRVRVSQAWPTPVADVVIVELKAAPGDENLVAEVVANLPPPVDKCSKFVLASAPEEGPLRAVAPS